MNIGCTKNIKEEDEEETHNYYVVATFDATTLPVLGIDLVSLPVGRHLASVCSEKHSQEWTATSVDKDLKFPLEWRLSGGRPSTLFV